MKRNIFLSYRRDDSPGYVSRLEDELERTFGEDRVFRDATDIPGGTKWKNVIEENLRRSAVLLVVIGPRWEQIWQARRNDEVNYVALELERAHELNVPIIPVTLDGVKLSKDLELGSIAFMLENQFHDISDRQGRWGGDFARLVRLLEGIEGIGAAQTASKTPVASKKTGGKPEFKWIAGAVGVVLIAGVWLGVAEQNAVDEPVPTQPAPITGVANHNNDQPLQDANAGSPPRPALVPRSPPAATQFPDISGTWRGKDGTLYYLQQSDDGTFAVQSPGYASGRGQFLNNMPRKFQIALFGIGRGEFSVSADGNKIIGWIQETGNSQQEFDTLVRVD